MPQGVPLFSIEPGATSTASGAWPDSDLVKT